MSINSLREIFQGNEDAVKLMLMVHEISHTWDDLIDKDKPVTADQTHRVFWIAIVGLAKNGFYRQFQDDLLPVMEAGILNYVASVEMEKTPGHQRQLAHTARYAAGDVALLIARIIGGVDWAMNQAACIKLLLQTDKFEDFDREMEAKYGSI